MLLFLVNDMLDIFQIKNGQFHKNEREVNLRESFQQIEEMFKVATEQKGLAFTVNFDPSVPMMLYTDDQRIKQVTMNLLQNAVKFTMKGGIAVYVGYDSNKKLVIVRVCDSGIGISD